MAPLLAAGQPAIPAAWAEWVSEGLRVTYFQKNPNVSELREPLSVFFSGIQFGRYLNDPRLNRADAVRHEIERLELYAQEAEVRVARSADGLIIGLLGFHFSKWDTDLLQKRMAIVRYFLVEERSPYENPEVARQLLTHFHEWAAREQVEVVVMKLDAAIQTPILLVQQEGYRFFECANHVTCDYPELPAREGVKHLRRFATTADLPLLKEIAAKHFFRRSHFFLDPRFTKEQAEGVYAKWIESAVVQGQKVLLYEEDDAVRGFFVYEALDLKARFQRKYAVWKMAVLDKSVRGRGSGWRLFHSTIASCRELGADAIDSSYAVHNVPSHNIHAKLGFRLVNVTYTFHRWLVEPGRKRSAQT